MDWKDFLKPNSKKFILPVILLLLSIYVVASSFSIVAVFDKHTCETSDLSKQYISAEKENKTDIVKALNDTAQKTSKKIEDELKTVNMIGVRESAILVSTLDPAFPLPCELAPSPLCIIYSSKKSYDCLADLANFTKENMENKTISDSIKIREYSEPTIPIVVNFAFVFIEGYAISCLIFYFKKNRKPKHTIKNRK